MFLFGEIAMIVWFILGICVHNFGSERAFDGIICHLLLNYAYWLPQCFVHAEFRDSLESNHSKPFFDQPHKIVALINFKNCLLFFSVVFGLFITKPNDLHICLQMIRTSCHSFERKTPSGCLNFCKPSVTCSVKPLEVNQSSCSLVTLVSFHLEKSCLKMEHQAF